MTQERRTRAPFVPSRIGRRLLVIVFVLLIPAACSGDEKPPAVQSEARLYAGPLNANLADFVEELDRKVPKLLEGYGTPGASIALVSNGELAWARGYGWADVGRRLVA